MPKKQRPGKRTFTVKVVVHPKREETTALKSHSSSPQSQQSKDCRNH